LSWADGTSTVAQQRAGRIAYSHADDSMRFDTAATERMRIDSSGRLLVGASSLSTDLATIAVFQGYKGSPTSEGIIYISRGSAPGTNDDIGSIRFSANNHTLAAMVACKRDGGTWTAGSSQPTQLTFSTTADGDSSPTERMRIQSTGIPQFSSTGSFYADTTAPSFVVNTNGGHSLTINNTNSTDPRGIFIYQNTDKNDSTSYFLRANGGGTNRAYIYSNGGIANYQSNDSNLCDEREKKNIETLDSTWNCLKNWELKKFHYNEDADTDDKRYGVIAQQVAPHCPEVISDWVKQEASDAVLDDDGNVVTPAKEEIVRMGVKEQQMMWMAIKALQEAQERIETLEQRLSDAGL